MSNQVQAFHHVFQAAAATNGNGTAMGVGGLAGVGLQIEGVTTATVNFEGTIDGSTWYAIMGHNYTAKTQAVTATADGIWVIPVAGLDQLRARISGYSGGTIDIVGKGVLDGVMVNLEKA